MTRTSIEATSAYYSASPMTRIFRWGLGASQQLWPALAVRAAYRLFCTPLPPKWLSRRRSWSPDWQIEQWPFENASLTLYTRRAASTAPVVLLVHGWGGHAGQMLALADEMLKQGLQPVLLEMPAHGRSRGASSNLPQFARVLDYAAVRCAAWWRIRWRPTPLPTRPAGDLPLAAWYCSRRRLRRWSTHAFLHTCLACVKPHARPCSGASKCVKAC